LAREVTEKVNNIGLSGLVLILIVALLVFGPSKLPELGRAFGKTLREFKNATQGLVDDEDSDMKEKRKDVK
jgi:sec-independent protein translocase protein TatA